MKRPLIALTFLALLLTSAWAAITQPVIQPEQGETPPLVNSANLEKHVRMLAETLPPRSDDVEDLLESADYIAAQFEKYQTGVERQIFSVRGVKYQNVIAHIPGTNPDKQKVVIGAHYDVADQLPGADDNASGVAGLLELARIYAQHPPQHPTELVAYALEEPPYFRTEYMGSFHHARQLKENGETIAMMICLEMIGYFSDQEGSQDYPAKFMTSMYPTTGNYIALVSDFANINLTRQFKKAMLATSRLPVESINAPAILPGIDFSDHQNYWKHGFPALMVTDTAFYRNKNYHTENDTPDTLNYQKMADVIDGVYHSIERL